MTNLNYIGNELELFSHAKNWKNYWGSKVKPYLGTRVLEVGAGLGGTTQYLYDSKTIAHWTCLEPDLALANGIEDKIKAGLIPRCEILTDTLANLKKPKTTLDGRQEGAYDSILYIDVIEHIENDKAELLQTLPFLQTGGCLIIIVPAHQFLYSPFDEAIGHYRRYNMTRLKEVIPQDYEIVKAEYLDSIGLFASLANKLFLNQKYPTLKQILFWDRYIIPVSIFFDKLFFHNIGKSVLLVAKKI